MLYVGELRLGDRFPDAPQRARLLAALRDRRVAQRAAPGAVGERAFDALVQGTGLAAVAELGEHVPGMSGREGILRIRRVREHRLEAGPRDELEGRQPVAEALAQQSEQLDRGAWAVEGDPCRRRSALPRKQ